MKKIRVVFFGTPEFSVPFFEFLCTDPRMDVVAAVSQPDRPSGRDHETRPTPVKEAAQRHNADVYQPDTLRSEEARARLRAYAADVFVVVAYGKLIPSPVLSIPPHGCVNVHPSLLPAYRGPSPMQAAIANGDPTTGVTIMLLDEGMDTGPILSFVNIGIDSDETYESLSRKAQEQGAPLLADTLARLMTGEITPMAQDNARATVTRLLEREDGHVDWTKTLAEIDRLVRAYDPWPGAWNMWVRNGVPMRLKLRSVAPADFKSDLPPGTVSSKDGRLFVDCANGTMELLRVQPEGKPAMDSGAFLRGYSDVIGATLA